MSYNNTKLVAGLLGYALLACSISGCSFDSFSKTATETSSESSSSATGITYLDADDMFTDRDKEVGYDEDTATAITLSDDASSCDSSSVTISNNTITITDEGTYLLTGSLSDGQVIVNADDKKVQLVLDSVNINCDTSAALYVKAANKVFVTLASDSENSLSNTSDFVAIDDNNIDAVIFSKDDLTLNGSGTLTVTAKYGHGIVSKDDLVITSGTYQITAAKHALSGKDSVRIADGVLTLDAGTDGIHSENTDNDAKGFIYIANGDISITADSDGFDAEETLQVDGGNIEVAAGDDGLHADGDLIITDGTINVTKSYEGLEGMTVTVEDGNISVVSSDDGINAAGDGTSEDSSSDTKDSSADNNSGDTNANDSNTKGSNSNKKDAFTPPSGEDKKTPPNGDSAQGNTPPEKPDGSDSTEDWPEPPNGFDKNDNSSADSNSNSNSDSKSADLPDGNAGPGDGNGGPGGGDGAPGGGNGGPGGGDGAPGGGNGGPGGGNGAPGGGNGGPGGGMEEATDYNLIQISGGKIYINANGDGIDSNGNLTVTGGEIYVDGPTSGGDGALDCSGTALISGGTVIAVGSSGMAENFDSSSAQGSMITTVSDSMITGDITLTDSEGNTIVSYSPSKEYSSVAISCADLKEGETYTLVAGDTSTSVSLNQK